MASTFERIAQLKQQYTDRKVRVVDHRPELQRFAGQVGQIKTINMNGSALVVFEQFVNDLGWHDIPLKHLEIIDQQK